MKENESIKEIMEEIRKIEKGKETYMQDMPKATHHDNASTDSVESVTKISKCSINLVKCGYST